MERAPYIVPALAVALLSAVLTACSGTPSGVSSPGSAVTLVPGRPSAPVEVSARANIFGAGHDVPPAPGRGGAGVLPPVVYVPPGEGRRLTFPDVAGEVNPIVGEADFVGPAGDGGRFGTTDVKSFDGISGIVHRRNGMFLVGVLLDDDIPSQTAPERLDVTEHVSSEVTVPELGQTFLIGDGRDVVVRAPDTATRLFLGFADGFLYRGSPGWYDNNDGRLTVTVQVDSG